MDATCFLGEPRVVISRSALLHNVKVLRSHLRDGVKICAMVKANAYGHNAELVADALCNFSADGMEGPAIDALAVATLEEAAALGEPPVPVLVMRPLENVYVAQQREALELAIAMGRMLTVASAEAAGDLARLATACNKRVAVQIMLDTGMSREGVCPVALERIAQSIVRQPSLRLAGLCTHFAGSEEAQSLFTLEQLEQFLLAVSPIAARIGRLILHAANSGAIFIVPDSHLDMVRPGISLYGIDPTCQPSADRPLRPAMRWTAPLTMIRSIRAGTAVGYGQSWWAKHDTRIGLIPVGYADGYWRAFSNRAVTLVHSKPAPVVGRVSMDYTTIDLGNIPEATVGDEVTLLDDDPLSPASAYALARWAGTVPYEVFCSIGQRMHRIVQRQERDGDDAERRLAEE